VSTGAISHDPVRMRARVGSLTVYEYHCVARDDERAREELHTRPAIGLVRKGSFIYRRDGRSYPLRVGAALLAQAGQEYTCTHEYGCGDQCLVFSWEPAAVDGERPFAQAALPPLPRLEALARLGEAAFADPGQPAAVDEVAAVLLAAVQTELARARHQTPAVRRSQPRDRDRALAAAALIEARADEPLGLEALAAHAGLSPFHFLRLFRRELGVTPHQHLVRTRLRRAIALLLDTARPVTEIAYEAGFGDLSNFVRTFHREVGCAPLAFRKGRLLSRSKILQVAAPRAR
jgi:AraC-like DNA-binding protein